MKRLVVGVLLGLLVLSSIEAAAAQLYTAQNLWLHRGRTGSCINYQRGTLLPAGTPVEGVEVCNDHDGCGDIFSPFISFYRPGDPQRYVVTFNPRWHPGQTAQDCSDRLFGDKTFSQLTGGMSEEERNAVRRGAALRGMTRDEVLVSYGRPPAHKTPNLAANIWWYWTSKLRKKKICFDVDGLAERCDELRSDDL